MVHNTADKVAEARLAAITHELMKEKIVPKGYTKRHGMDYDLIDYRVDQLIKMFGNPDDYSPTRTDRDSGRRFMGYAIWRYPTPVKAGVPQMPFLKKIMVKDHLLLQGDRLDFLFTKVDIAWHSTNTLEKANMISESIMINHRYETCTASSHCLTDNLIGHYIAWRTAMGVIPEWKARKELKAFTKVGMAEVEKAADSGKQLMMPAHATIIDYLNTMFEGHAKQSEIAEEIMTQALEVLDFDTDGQFIYKTPDEIRQIIDDRSSTAMTGYSRETSVGTISINNGRSNQRSSMSTTTTGGSSGSTAPKGASTSGKFDFLEAVRERVEEEERRKRSSGIESPPSKSEMYFRDATREYMENKGQSMQPGNDTTQRSGSSNFQFSSNPSKTVGNRYASDSSCCAEKAKGLKPKRHQPKTSVKLFT